MYHSVILFWTNLGSVDSPYLEGGCAHEVFTIGLYYSSGKVKDGYTVYMKRKWCSEPYVSGTEWLKRF